MRSRCHSIAMIVRIVASKNAASMAANPVQCRKKNNAVHPTFRMPFTTNKTSTTIHERRRNRFFQNAITLTAHKIKISVHANPKTGPMGVHEGLATESYHPDAIPWDVNHDPMNATAKTSALMTV